MSPSKSGAVNRTVLGAWLIKWSPAVWDLAGFVDGGGADVTSCSVAMNYRSRMMAPGDRVLFWVSGSDRRFVRGIWGSGTVTGQVEPHRESHQDAPDRDDHWLDPAARNAVRHRIEVAIPLLDVPITDTELRSAGIDDLEVQRMPAGSNPSWVSREQLARIAERLHAQL